MSFSFFFLKHQDEESGSDSEFRPRRTSFEDKVKIAEKKQETIPEPVSEKKGVGFAVETPEENNKEAVEEVSPLPQNINSYYLVPYISFNICSKNLVLHQDSIPS